jgi:hypothetical protein
MALQMSEEIKEISSNLTITDMRIINTFIEHVATRGIIKPVDFLVIGNIYEKIKTLLKQDDSQISS